MLQQETNRLLIADFGLASSQSDEASLQIVAGTPAYMSPEQSQGELVDHRSDLFSLGTLLYQMLTGKLPFEHADPKELLRLIRETQPPTVHSIRSSVPHWLSSGIEQLMAKSPENRIQSAQAFLNILENQSHKHQVEPSSRMQLSLMGIGLAACVLVGVYLQFSRQTDSTNSKLSAYHSAQDDTPVSTGQIRQGVWIEGEPQQFESLAEAIASAEDGATIRLANDIQASRLIVQGKRLTIAAAQGTRPHITCREPEKGGPAQFLIRTRSDLTLRGLIVDWQPIEDIPVYSDGQLAYVVGCQLDANLLLEDCELSAGQTGAVVGVGGNATIRNCTLTGRDFAIGWMAYNSKADVTGCVLKADVGVCVAFPPLGTVTDESTRLKLSHTKFLARSAVDLALLRVPERAVPITAESCQFQGASVITLSGLTNRAPVLQTAADIRKQAQNLIIWSELNCEFSESNTFLDARTFRSLKRWKNADFHSLSEWQEFWR